MVSRLREFFKPPVFEDDNQTRIAGLLHVILLTLVIVLGFLALITDFRLTKWVTGGMSAFFFGLWLFMRRGAVRTTSWALMFILMVGVSLIVYFNGTIRVPAASAFVACVIVAGLLIGDWAAVGWVVVMCAVLFVLYRAEVSGLLPPVHYQTTGFLQWATYTGILCIAAVLLILANRSILNALALARRSAHTLAERNQELQDEIAERQQTEQALRESEEALRASEQKFSLAFQSNPTLMTISRIENGVYLEVNQAFLQKLGYTREEVIGKSSVELGLWGGDSQRDLFVDGLRVGGSLSNLEFLVRAKGGHALILLFSAEVLTIGNERVLLTIGHDITERKQAEEALRQKTEEFEQFFRCNLDLFCIADTDGNFVRLNPEWRKVLGYDLHDLEGRQFFDFVHPDDLPATVLAVSELSAQREIFNFINRYRCRDGSYRWIEWRSSPIGTRIYAAARDITERIKTEQALFLYNERLTILRKIDQAILQAQSPEAIAQASLPHLQSLIPCFRITVVEFDFQGGLYTIIASLADKPAQLHVGVKFSLSDLGQLIEFLHTGQSLVVQNTKQPSFTIKRDQVLQAEEVQAYFSVPMVAQGELIGALNFGADHVDAFTAEHIEIANDVARLLAIAIQQAHLHEQVQEHANELEQRVTERTAQLANINQELESFSYSVAHDLRAPLRAVDGFSRLLIEDYGEHLELEGQMYLGRIRAAIQRMSQLIDDLLGLSRLVRSEMHISSVNLSEIARAVADELRQSEPERDVKVEIADGLIAKGDARLLEVVLDNLLGNAWKFTSKISPAHIEFGAKPSGTLPGSGTFYVRDNGAGFSMEYVDKLFGAFQRLHNDGDFPGTGIGLATVKRIIYRHGGRVWAEAAEGQGATFYFTLAA
jgi:PAS domain S-box-containing protein